METDKHVKVEYFYIPLKPSSRYFAR